MSDSDPTAGGHTASPRLDSKGNPIRSRVSATRQDVADTWVLYMCFIIGLAAIIAFFGVGYAFPGNASVGDATTFNPIAGTIGAIGAVLGLLPFLGVFAVLRAKDA